MKYCCRKFKRFDKKYGGIVLMFDKGKCKEFREMWGLINCPFCGVTLEEIK